MGKKIILPKLKQEDIDKLFRSYREQTEVDHRLLMNPKNADALKKVLRESPAPTRENPVSILPKKHTHFVQDYSERIEGRTYQSVLWPRAVVFLPSLIDSEISFPEKWSHLWIDDHPKKMIFSTEKEIIAVQEDIALEEEGNLTRLLKEANSSGDMYGLFGKYEERIKMKGIRYYLTRLVIGVPSLVEENKLGGFDFVHAQYSKKTGVLKIRDKITDENELRAVDRMFAEFPRTYYIPRVGKGNL
jgi:hypothetical protein